MTMIDDTGTWTAVADSLGPPGQQYAGKRRAPEPDRGPLGVNPWWVLLTALLLAVSLVLGGALLADRSTVAPGAGNVQHGDGGGLPRTAAGFWDFPSEVPPAQRVIEVVDRVPSARWNVRTAVSWLDNYTLSRMKMVKRCSGTAYRCLIVKAGKVKGSSVGWARDGVVTIDTAKAAKRSEYGRYAVRRWLIVHELAHLYGLKHSAGKNVMNPTPGPGRLSFTRAQRQHLARR